MNMRNDNLDTDDLTVLGDDAELLALDRELRQVLAAAAPAHLAERICAAVAMEEPLRQAMRVTAPAGMADRIVAMTQGQLRGSRDGILARIGIKRPAVALAAAVVLAVEAGVWVTLAYMGGQHAASIAEMRQQIDSLGGGDVAMATADASVRELAMDVEQVAERVQSAPRVQSEFADAEDRFSDDLMLLEYEMQTF